MKIKKIIKYSLFLLLFIGVLIVAASYIGGRIFSGMVEKEAAELKASVGNEYVPKVTEKDLARLPKQVAAYLKASGVVGKEKIRFAVLEQKGSIRGSKESGWMEFSSTQYFTALKPGFVWHAKANMAGLPVSVRDRYFNGKGSMYVKALNLFAIVDAFGPELDQSAFARCFGELSMVPTAFLYENIKWSVVDKFTVRALVKDGDNEISADLKFNESNEYTEFICDRYRDEGGKPVMRRFIGRSSAYREIQGYLIPTKLSGSWVLPDGELEYARIEVLEARFE